MHAALNNDYGVAHVSYNDYLTDSQWSVGSNFFSHLEFAYNITYECIYPTLIYFIIAAKISSSHSW